MNVDLDGIKPGYTIRSDVFGFYLCTVAEAEQTDDGSPSAGYDLRSHWETLEEAVSALRNWQPTLRRARVVSPPRRALTTDAVQSSTIESPRPAAAHAPTMRRIRYA